MDRTDRPAPVRINAREVVQGSVLGIWERLAAGVSLLQDDEPADWPVSNRDGPAVRSGRVSCESPVSTHVESLPVEERLAADALL